MPLRCFCTLLVSPQPLDLTATPRATYMGKDCPCTTCRMDEFAVGNTSTPRS